MGLWRLAWPALHIMTVRVASQVPADPSATRVFQHKGWLPPVSKCPETCETLFSKLEDGGDEGKKIQHVEMQQRGGASLKAWSRVNVRGAGG